MSRAEQCKEKISPFLRGKLEELKDKYGEGHHSYRALALQYVANPSFKDIVCEETNLKHYEAGVDVEAEHGHIPGLERLYRRTLVIEPTLICSALCQYCLRKNYRAHTLTEEQLLDVAKYCGSEERRDCLNEVLVTGGDPLLVPKRMNFLVNALMEHAPNIRIVRIGSRLMTQSPEKFDSAVLSIFKNKPELRFELATQISHPVEFFPETVEIFKKMNDMGVKIYSQNVLLRGVNDDLETLVELYDQMRINDIEAHYLFHCCPIFGMQYLRPSVARSLELVRGLTMGGKISGRAKPMFAAMTDIGKIMFYENTIVKKEDGFLLLRSGYKLEERLAWNPSFRMPALAETDADGYLMVKYMDGVAE